MVVVRDGRSRKKPASIPPTPFRMSIPRRSSATRATPRVRENSGDVAVSGRAVIEAPLLRGVVSFLKW